MKVKEWIKENKTTLMFVGGVMLGNVVAGTIFYHRGFDDGYIDGTKFGSAVSARAARKALGLDYDAIDKVIKMLPEATKEIEKEFDNGRTA